MDFKRIDKTLVASIALHVLVLGWAIVSFSTRPLEATPVELMPVDIISADQLSKMTAGTKSGQKENQKRQVEKIAEATPPNDQPMGKIGTRDTATEAAPDPAPPTPKPVEIDKKPDPPKQAVKKDEPKPVEKKPDPAKVDPIAEALKKDDTKKKPPPKPEAKVAPPPPAPPKPKDYAFNPTKIALELNNKRDPTHQAMAGETLNNSPALGTAHGAEVALSQSEIDALRAYLHDHWHTLPVDPLQPKEQLVKVRFRLTRDRRLAAPPQVVEQGSSPRAQAAAEAAVRAVIEGQPFMMLHDETYEAWQDIVVTFDPTE